MPEFGEPLTPRELEVLEQLKTGATNRQIAQELVLSVNTVKVHVRNIFTKMGVESRTEATMVAIREGWVDVPGEEGETDRAEPDTLSLSEGAAGAELASSMPGTQPEPLPPLPWPKRLALVASLLLVVLVSAATWPRYQTTAVPESDESDVPINGNDLPDLQSESTAWGALSPMNTARSRFALVALPSGQLYAIAGETSGGVTDSMEWYDPEADQWTLLTANKPTRVSNVQAALVDRKIYVPGGWTADEQPTDVVEVYDLATETWEEVASLPRPVAGYALAADKERLYLFGGRDERGYVNHTFIYDVQQDRWQEGKEMPTPRAYAGAAALGARVYVIGGYDGQREQSTCQVYLLEKDEWEACGSLIQGRGGLGVVGVANKLYAIGGGWSDDYLAFSELYDLGLGAWQVFETPVSRQWRNLAIAATMDRFYVAGGWNGEHLNAVWEYKVLPWRINLPIIQP